MNLNPVVVIGAGPAGVAAALAAAPPAPVILLDEQPAPGGHQCWKPEQDIPSSSAHLNRQLRQAGVDYRPGTAVWGLFDGPTVGAYDSEHAHSIPASAVIVATGTVDRVWPVPGWHLDGGATPREVLVASREDRIILGTRFGVVGSGPDAEIVVEGIRAVGDEVAYRAVDLAGVRIEGETRVERLRWAEGDVPVDKVVLALGRRPDPSLVLQARARSAFLRQHLIEMPLLAGEGSTSLPGVYVAGEAAGVAESDAARHGSLVGSAAVEFVTGEPQSVPEHAPAIALAPLDLPLPDDPATIICREQMIDLGTVLAAINRGAYDVNDLRRQTRAGMGLGASRDTMPVLAALMLQHDPAIPDERLVARMRPPARPLPFRAVLAAAD